MLSTHPKVGMAVLVGVRVKAEIRALARRDAHSFLAVRAVRCIVALCCSAAISFSSSRRGPREMSSPDVLKTGIWLVEVRIKSVLSLGLVLFWSYFGLVLVGGSTPY